MAFENKGIPCKIKILFKKVTNTDQGVCLVDHIQVDFEAGYIGNLVRHSNNGEDLGFGHEHADPVHGFDICRKRRANAKECYQEGNNDSCR